MRALTTLLQSSVGDMAATTNVHLSEYLLLSWAIALRVLSLARVEGYFRFTAQDVLSN